MDSHLFDVLAISIVTVRSIILMAIGFGLVIFIHELGHFLAAKLVGIRAEEFAIGFGPKLIGIKYGETEYRINIIPLGGYVKMTGQEDSNLYTEENMAMDDPRSFNNRPIWARMLVVSAGVIMNIILAAILFMIIFSAGRDYRPSIVGSLREGYPAETAEVTGADEPGLKPGDEILAINDKEIYDFAKLQIAAILSDDDEVYKLTVRRPGIDKPLYAKVGLKPSISPTGNVARAFGITPCIDNVIGEDSGKFRKNDRITAVNGHKVTQGWQVSELIGEVEFAQPLIFEITRTENDVEKVFEVEIQTAPTWSSSRIRRDVTKQMAAGSTPPYDSNGFNVCGLLPRPRVLGVEPDSPAAEAGLKADDIISVFGPNMEAVSIEKLQNLCAKYLRQTVDIRVLRDGQFAGDINKIRVASYKNVARIGIAVGIDDKSLTIGEVKDDSAFAGVINGGDTITAVDDRAVDDWADFIKAIGELGEDDHCVLGYTTPSGSEKTTEPIAVSKLGFNYSDYGTQISDNISLRELLRQRKSSNPIEAVKWGTEATVDFIINTYATLSAFFTGKVSGKEFSGPIGIFSMGVQSGKAGDKHLLWLLAIISANLAVINFLPLPIVDGGLAVMLVIEKLRGKPLSVKVQNAVQIIGLVMIVIVFILLTYNDLARLVSSRW